MIILLPIPAAQTAVGLSAGNDLVLSVKLAEIVAFSLPQEGRP